jgi:hypothetical protein
VPRNDGRLEGEPIDPAWWARQTRATRRALVNYRRWLLERAVGIPHPVRSGVDWDRLPSEEKRRRLSLVQSHSEA